MQQGNAKVVLLSVSCTFTAGFFGVYSALGLGQASPLVPERSPRIRPVYPPELELLTAIIHHLSSLARRAATESHDSSYELPGGTISMWWR